MYLALSREEADGAVLELGGLGVGVYKVLGYDVEWDGIVRSRVPAVRGVASVTHEFNNAGVRIISSYIASYIKDTV